MVGLFLLHLEAHESILSFRLLRASPSRTRIGSAIIARTSSTSDQKTRSLDSHGYFIARES